MKCKKDFKGMELYYLLALLETTNLTYNLGVKILTMFPEIKDFFVKTPDDLIKLGLPSAEVKKLINPKWYLVEQDLRWAEQNGNRIITIRDKDYPQLLREIPNPPLLLFVMGDCQLLASPQLAIVGSRNPTPSGLETAAYFAQELVQTGLVITSGFACGIDAASHKGAMTVFGKTVAVMGTGLNYIYPSRHKILAREIVAGGGVLLSEFPLSAQANAWRFPLRNRIISGLSMGALVIEATIRSGSLITARLASEQGREVFAIPGSIYNPQTRGCHYLIRQGAKLVEQPEDILEELQELTKLVTITKSTKKNPQEKNKLDREHHKLLNCIGFEITSVDVLAQRSNLTIQQINTMLMELELAGLIQEVVGGYVRCG
jgi:DNA processing protein